MARHSKMIEELNDVLEKNYDAEKGYRKAAEEVHNQRLQTFFREKSTERSKFGDELKAEIRSLGGDPEQSGSTKGSLHRGWIDFKSSLSSDNEEAVLEEVERGEKAALKDYRELIHDKDVPVSTRQMIERQCDRIEATLSRVDAMEDIR